MWNSHFFGRISLFLRNTAFHRIALALGFSVILHAFLIGKFYLAAPEAKKDENQVIVAQLVEPEKPTTHQPTVVVAPKMVVQPKKSAKLDKAAPIKKWSAIEPPVEASDVAQAGVVQNVASINAGVVVESAVLSPDKSLESERADDQVAPEEPQVADDVVNVNQAVFKYVEMHFAVFTDKELASGGGSVGEAAVVYEQLPETTQYKIKSTVHAKGLASLFVPDLLQISQGNITEKGLQPTYYLYQFGDKKNKTYQADFDWPAGQLHLHNAKVDKSIPLAEGTQDLLSFMYQFMFVQPLQTMQLSVTNGKKIGIYTYAFEGEETLNSQMGVLNTVHLSRASSENEKKTELWLALDYQYVPVKIRETDKDGKVYELLVTHLKTSPSFK
jgi:hypothetical protein